MWLILWTLLASANALAPPLVATFNVKGALRFHRTASCIVWFFNFIYIITLVDFQLPIVLFTIFQLIVNLLNVIIHNKDYIILNSASFALLVCLNIWGDESFEILALSLALEIATWIIVSFIQTIVQT